MFQVGGMFLMFFCVQRRARGLKRPRPSGRPDEKDTDVALHFGVRHPQHREEDDTSASTTTTDLFESKSAVTCTGRVLRNLQHGIVLSK